MSKRIIISLSICLAFVLSSNAQSQLTFNQVLLVPLTSQGDTVPQGKVWKVESAATLGQSYVYFYIDDMISTVLWNGTNPESFNTLFPMWLPAGTIVKEGSYVNALSIIEFNIE